MKTISEICKDFDVVWLSGATSEIYHLKTKGLWPMHCPHMNELRRRISAEGYPQDQVMNIAIDFVTLWALGVFSELLKVARTEKAELDSL